MTDIINSNENIVDFTKSAPLSAYNDQVTKIFFL